MELRDFQELVWQEGGERFRDMPWRTNTDPYFVLVSELMLQQTQVDRVIPKFNQFITAFPSIRALAAAPLGEVLKVWSGLGYNRRAKFLHAAARKVVGDFDGMVPDTLEDLTSLPGVGPNTAGAILVYSFNKPMVFIETNIRTVYFHHFFASQALVDDKEILELVKQTLDHDHPRQWYWALMDYGSWLKKQGAGKIDQSRHYKKQTPLKGSLREVRGLIIKELTAGDQSENQLATKLPSDERFVRALQALQKEGIVRRTGDRLHLPR